MKNFRFFSVLIAAFLLCACESAKYQHKTGALTGCVNSEPSDGRQNQFESGLVRKVRLSNRIESTYNVLSRMAELNVPSLSLAIMHNGSIDWSKTYNVKNNEMGLNCFTQYQVASLSKPVTLMATIRMQSKGKIDFDQNIDMYLKSFKLPQGKQTESNPITFRNVLNHTSGITPGGFLGYSQTEKVPSDIEVLSGSFSNSPKLNIENLPGDRLAYSGLGYVLAQVALQDHFESDFGSIMDNWIIKPLRMHHSDFISRLKVAEHNSKDLKQYALIAEGHKSNGEKVEGGWKVHPELAAAGLWSTANDMATFMLEIYKGYQGTSSVFTKDDIEYLLEHEKHGHAFGFLVGHEGGETRLTHYGGNEGYRTGMTLNLETGDGLVFLTNSNNGIVLGNELLLTASKLYGWADFKQQIRTERQEDPEKYETYVGKYKWNNQVDLIVNYEKEKQQLSIVFPNGDRYELIPVEGEGSKFIHQDTGIEVTFNVLNHQTNFSLYGQIAEKSLDN